MLLLPGADFSVEEEEEDDDDSSSSSTPAFETTGTASIFPKSSIHNLTGSGR